VKCSYTSIMRLSEDISQQVYYLMTVSDLKVLWAESAGLCSKCRLPIIRIRVNNNKFPVGEMAHIKGEKQTAPRYDPDVTQEERDDPNNRIVLCPTCHTEIDKDEAKYSNELLYKIKDDHIKYIQDKLQIAVSNITFAELEIIIKYLITRPIYDDDMRVIPASAKIKKNDLSTTVDKNIKIGLMQRRQVMEYLNQNIDPQFSDRLRGGFIKRYLELKKQGIKGDSLFYSLLDFSSNYSDDFNTRAADLAILSYFFEICDVFEK